MPNSVLIIAYEFPPLNRGGVHRIMRFAKYLRLYDEIPTVITVEESVYKNEQLDKELLNNQKTTIIRTPILVEKSKDNYYLSLTDSIGRRWWPYLASAIKKYIKDQTPQAVLVTAPPFSMLNIARRIYNEFNVPIILDMRDAWSTWNIVPFPTKIHYLLTKRLERKAIDSAHHVLVTSKQTKIDLVDAHGIDNEKKIKVIHNAYEGKVKEVAQVNVGSKVSLGYVGSFYFNPISQKLLDSPWWEKKPYQIFQYTPRKENWLYRSPYFIFKIFRDLFNSFPDAKTKVDLVFAGKKPIWFDSMVEQFQIGKNVEHLGILSKKDSIKFQQSCNALLLTSSKVENGRDYSIAGKTFEYFVSGKPIIGFVKNGAQKDILLESGMSLVIDPDDPEKAVEKLKDWLQGKVLLEPDYRNLEKYSSTYTVRSLSEIIKQI
jgi:glycosyltransferase involved in cell wall biosynthesis